MSETRPPASAIPARMLAASCFKQKKIAGIVGLENPMTAIRKNKTMSEIVQDFGDFASFSHFPAESERVPFHEALRTLKTSRQSPAARKRVARKREAVSRHYLKLTALTLSTLGAPDFARDFFAAIVATVGWTPEDGIQIYDDAIANACVGPVPKPERDDRDAAVERQKARFRQQRKRLDAWQGLPENPLLFDYKSWYDPDLGAQRNRYVFHVLELIRDIAEDVDPYRSTDREIEQAILFHVRGYVDRWSGAAKRLPRKREMSPESDEHRGATLVIRGLEKKARRDGEDAAVEMFKREFLDRLMESEIAKKALFENRISLDSQDVNPAPPVTDVTGPPAFSAAETPAAGPARDGEICSVISSNNRAKNAPPPPVLGISIDDFVREHFAERGPDRPINYRLPRVSDDWLSLADLESFDPRAPHSGGERRFCCPLCGGSKPKDAAHRSLSLNVAEGVYRCHRCDAGGKLREFMTDAPAFTVRPRSVRVPLAPIARPAELETWRRWFAKARPIASTPGADYLTWRGIPADVASAAGVQCGTWYQDGQPFEGVVFPIKNDKGELIAAQARAIEGGAKNTRGPKKDGVFLSMPDALDASEIAITEAPIDALALAAAGQPAVALCGTQWPDWLIDRLAGRRVLIAFDADEAGDEAARELAEVLAGRATVRRLRPRGAKDWAELAQSYGLATIGAQLEDVNE